MSNKGVFSRLFPPFLAVLFACGACSLSTDRLDSSGTGVPSDTPSVPSDTPSALEETERDHFGDNDQIETNDGCDITSLLPNLSFNRSEDDAEYYTLTVKNGEYISEYHESFCNMKSLKVFPVDNYGVRLNSSIYMPIPFRPVVMKKGEIYKSEIRFEKNSYNEQCRQEEENEQKSPRGRSINRLELVVNGEVVVYTPSSEKISRCYIDRVGGISMTPLTRVVE